VAVLGSDLQKTGGCQGCNDAGALSRQMIRSGDGFAEFTVGEANTFWLAGLSHTGASTRYNDIDFAFRFNGAGRGDVMENGVYQGGDTTYRAGDVFRVAVVGGRVQYSKNGAVLRESQKMPRLPLVVDAALGSLQATIRNARIETGERTLARNNRRYRWDEEEGVVGTSGQTIYVDATRRWTDTGLYVTAGDRIVFNAEGAAQLSSDPNDIATPAGSRSGRRAVDAPLRERLAGSLIARIGDSGTILVGNHGVVDRAPVSGHLYLGVNDDYLADNSGQYRVDVMIEH